MIPVASGVQVWLASGHTDMRKGFDGLALLVQETLKRNPHGGHLFVFRGRRGGLIKVLWHDGQGMCLFAKRLERGRFVWPSSGNGVVTITPAQLGYRRGHLCGHRTARRGSIPRADQGRTRSAHLCAATSPAAGNSEGWRESPRTFNSFDPGSGGARCAQAHPGANL
jgi:transposase